MAFVLGHSVSEGPVSSVLDATKTRYTTASVSERGAPSAPKSREYRPLTCTSLCDLILLIRIFIWNFANHHGKELKISPHWLSQQQLIMCIILRDGKVRELRGKDYGSETRSCFLQRNNSFQCNAVSPFCTKRTLILHSWTYRNPNDTDHSVALYLRCARKLEVKINDCIEAQDMKQTADGVTDRLVHWLNEENEQMTNETNGLINIAGFKSR